jgi:hypothetical protein
LYALGAAYDHAASPIGRALYILYLKADLAVGVDVLGLSAFGGEEE